MTETTPDGKNQHEPGAKVDAGKNRLALVLEAFAKPLWDVGLVGTFGAVKYTEDGWLYVDNAKARYKDAMYRHYLKEKMGELYDQDSGLLHAAHAAWNALAYLHFVIEEQQIINQADKELEQLADLHSNLYEQQERQKYEYLRYKKLWDTQEKNS